MTIHALGQPNDRALDALLAGYASGSLTAPLHALVAGHLALTPGSRAFVRNLESANAAVLEASPPIAVANRDRTLAAIFASPPAEEAAAGTSAPQADDIIPDPLRRYLGAGLADIRWRPLIPGVKAFKVEKSARGEAVLYWIKSGRKMPSHTHDGSEFTLVLKGSFSDVSGQYRRGDIAIADQDVDHIPVADEGEDCICYAVTDAPLRLTGPIGRVLQRLFGRH